MRGGKLLGGRGSPPSGRPPFGRPAVADLRAQKGKHPLSMPFVETPEEAGGGGEGFGQVVPDRVAAGISRGTPLIIWGHGRGAGGHRRPQAAPRPIAISAPNFWAED